MKRINVVGYKQTAEGNELHHRDSDTSWNLVYSYLKHTRARKI